MLKIMSQGPSSPKLLPPPDKMSQLFDHAALVQKINSTLPEHPADRIKAGENPYKAMREFRGLSVKETGKSMNIDVKQYIAFETFTINMTRDEVLAFCHLMKCWPYELHEEGRPLRPEIRDAMIHIISNAEDYGLRGDGSRPCKKMHAILSKEASPGASINMMARWVISFSGQSHAKIVTDFLTQLIDLDGTYQLRKIDNHIDYLVDDRIEFETNQRQSVNETISTLEVQKQKVWKNLNQLGWRLYPAGQSGRPDWKEVFTKIREFKSLYCGDDSQKTMNAYRRTPYSIGRETWPAFKSTTVGWQGKIFPWDDARHIHADMLLDYWERGVDINRRKDLERKMGAQIEFFKMFIDQHRPVFHRFMNRQEIMHSMAVRPVMDEQLRQTRYQPPEITSAHPAMRLFING